MRETKRLMILGASYTQLPLIRAARRMGVRTIAASIPGDYPGFEAADEKVYVDISRPDDVVRAAEEVRADGVATCGLDLGMAAIGAVCSGLGLPGPSREAARLSSNKLLMKEALVRAGVQTARFFCIRSSRDLEEAMEQLDFPVILKAVDQMGSRGIFRCDSPDQVRQNYPLTMAATRQDYCLLEEFIEGEIFGVEAMIQDGSIVFQLPNNIEAFQCATVTPIGHSVPCRLLDSLGDQIREQTEKAIRALGLDNCPVNCDFIRRGDRVYVIELTGRSGATGLSEMVSIWYDIPYYEMIVRVALGMPVREYFEGKETGRPALTHTLISDRAGVVRTIRSPRLPWGWVKDLSFNIAAGDRVRPYTNGRDRIGQVILDGDSLEDCERKLRMILSCLRLDLEGDIPLNETPIHGVDVSAAGPGRDGGSAGTGDPGECGGNRIWVKREDMLPFSLGGNKARFARYYMEDLERSGANAMILYGGYQSNLCRIFSAACRKKGIPCSLVNMVDDAGEDASTVNARLIRAMGVREYRCHKAEIAGTVKKAMDDLAGEGYRPYYIYGNCLGQGRSHIPMQAYVDLYREINLQELVQGIRFDYIFLASSTNATQSGLLAGRLIEGQGPRIVGISVSRGESRAREVILANLEDYRKKTACTYRSDPAAELEITDRYLEGGYGAPSDRVNACIREAYEQNGLQLDPVYTGKAWAGMLSYLREHEISGKKILFLHTGGTPLFFAGAEEIFGEGDNAGLDRDTLL